ncbi:MULTISPECIES: protease modulator HflC [unclassified Bartonella]|uniref:protease modulator HflC n=1 Tax=unclassified Bartonella TaxID=2645622 RepID=UPI0015FD6595|nr:MULTISPECIES: protease modulator HflC [unclassified Bartonella]UXN02588.1 protease modulator HflC [Bartonella sp. HY406]
MKQGSLIAILIALVVIVVGISMSVYIVYPNEQVVVKRVSQIVRTEKAPGLYFKMPLVEDVVRVDNRLLRYDLPTYSVQVKNGRYYEVDAFLIYRIVDAEMFIKQIGDGRPETAEERNLDQRFRSALGAVYGVRDFNAALSDQRIEMMRDIQRQMVEEAKPLGIDIVDVRIRKTDLPTDLSNGIYERMNQERRAAAESILSLGNAERISIIAKADRSYVESVAIAARDAEVLKGEGQAEAARLMNDAVESNPNFYQFWLSMDKYQSIKDTPMVITPDWSFFDLMRNPTGVVKPQN